MEALVGRLSHEEQRVAILLAGNLLDGQAQLQPQLRLTRTAAARCGGPGLEAVERLLQHAARSLRSRLHVAEIAPLTRPVHVAPRRRTSRRIDDRPHVDHRREVGRLDLLGQRNLLGLAHQTDDEALGSRPLEEGRRLFGSRRFSLLRRRDTARKEQRRQNRNPNFQVHVPVMV